MFFHSNGSEVNGINDNRMVQGQEYTVNEASLPSLTPIIFHEWTKMYSLFHKKRYAFSQKVSKIFIPFFYALTVRSKGYGTTTDSFQSCSKCQILYNIKLWVLSTLNVTKQFFLHPCTLTTSFILSCCQIA